MNTKKRESQEKDFSKDKRKEEKPFTEEVNPNSTVDLLEVVEFFLCPKCIGL